MVFPKYLTGLTLVYAESYWSPAANSFVFITHARHPILKMWVNITPNCLYNHSKEKENCKIVTVKNVKNLHTTKAIERGQELFVDYTKDLDLEQPNEDWNL